MQTKLSISKFSDLTQVFQIYFSIKQFFPINSPWGRKPHIYIYIYIYIDTPHIFALPDLLHAIATVTTTYSNVTFDLVFSHNPQSSHLFVAFRLPICYMPLYFILLYLYYMIYLAPPPPPKKSLCQCL